MRFATLNMQSTVLHESKVDSSVWHQAQQQPDREVFAQHLMDLCGNTMACGLALHIRDVPGHALNPFAWWGMPGMNSVEVAIAPGADDSWCNDEAMNVSAAVELRGSF